MKKKEGSVDKIAIALMTIIMGGILTFTNIAFTRAMDTKAEVNAIVRQYLLDIESNGALTHVQKINLRDSLVAVGVKDPVILVNDAGNYGSIISIKVGGKIILDMYDYYEGKSAVELPFEVFRQSISKKEDTMP